jgi:hypothetical protein
MELNVLLRGQSNADLLTMSSDWPTIATTVEQLLGFDGVTNTVNLLASSNSGSNNNTIDGGTAFIGDWVQPASGGWQSGWANNTYETGLLNYINALPAAEKAAPTAVVWLHNEYDSTNPALTTAEWMSAVQFDAEEVRQALGQSAVTVPYMFVNAIPYGGGSPLGSYQIAAVNQAIKVGMQTLAASATFDAVVGVQADDVNMDGTYYNIVRNPGDYGGPHFSSSDANLIDARIARAVAQTFAQYALPGSPIASGQFDAFGPQATAAQKVGTNQVVVTATLDHASLSAVLSADAAAGLGWSILDGSQTILATAAQVTDATHVLVTFAGTVPTDSTARLYYAFGYGRLGTGEGDAGQGNAIYDTQQMPIYTAATGVPIAAGVPCLVAGTRILMADGSERAVEQVRPGDRVRAARCGAAEVRWVGHRSLRFAAAGADDGRPIRVLAHAFGPGMPACEVRLSPDHAVFIAGVLIPVQKLVNGVSILRERGHAAVRYVHVELAQHDLLFAAGLPVESFLDTGNRAQFDAECGVRPMRDTQRADGDGLAATLHAYAERGCAPFHLAGPMVEAVRARLLRRARATFGADAARAAPRTASTDPLTAPPS